MLWSCEVTPVYGACQVVNARYGVRKVPPQVPRLSASFLWGLLQPGYTEWRREAGKKEFFFVEIGDLRGGLEADGGCTEFAAASMAT